MDGHGLSNKVHCKLHLSKEKKGYAVLAINDRREGLKISSKAKHFLMVSGCTRSEEVKRRL